MLRSLAALTASSDTTVLVHHDQRLKVCNLMMIEIEEASLPSAIPR
jgi:hypothetical protein